MASFRDMVKFFFSKAPPEAKYKTFQQRVVSKKATITKKMTSLSEILEKYLKKTELSQLEAKHVDATMLLYNYELDKMLVELNKSFEGIEELSYSREDLVEHESSTD